jgi:hypothetical protein
MKKSLLLIVLVLVIGAVSLFFIFRKSKRQKLFACEKCCAQMLHDREAFIDSLFKVRFPGYFYENSIQAKCQTGSDNVKLYLRFPNGNAPTGSTFSLSLPSTFYPPIKYEHWYSHPAIAEYTRYSPRAKNEAIPRYKIEIVSKPDSIHNHLIETWTFYSATEIYNASFLDGPETYTDEFVSITYQPDKNKLSTDVPPLSHLFESANTRIKTVDSWGSLKSDLIKEWYDHYIDTHECLCE